MVYLHIILFLAFQVAANLLFKWGSSAPHLYWWGFILGNAVGMTSILFMLGMYQNLPAANVVAIGTGGTFLLNQIAMFLVYHEKIQTGALIGIVLIFAGILLVAFCNQPQKQDDEPTPPQEERIQEAEVKNYQLEQRVNF